MYEYELPTSSTSKSCLLIWCWSIVHEIVHAIVHATVHATVVHATVVHATVHATVHAAMVSNCIQHEEQEGVAYRLWRFVAHKWIPRNRPSNTHATDPLTGMCALLPLYLLHQQHHWKENSVSSDYSGCWKQNTQIQNQTNTMLLSRLRFKNNIIS